MRVFLDSVGCKLNQGEIDALGRRFAEVGHRIVSRAEEADLCVFNSCVVTHMAARKSRQVVRRMRRANRSALMVVTGCYAELAPDEVCQIGGVDLVIGNRGKERLVDLLIEKEVLSPSGESLGVPYQAPRTRAFVKVQDGCDNACTYCIVTVARGEARSRPPKEIISEVVARVAEGYKEIVLTGVHIGSYGKDGGAGCSLNLRELLEEILTRTELARLRLSSLEPWDFDASFLPLWRDARLCRHLHLPLQSGCDLVLGRMGRHYTCREFSEMVERARQVISDLAVTTDVMVGFPGETEAEFRESYRFVKAMGFAKIHVFKYSLRAGTLAAAMPEQVASELKTERSRAMLDLAESASRSFRRRFLSRRMEVLWESRRRGQDALWNGLTSNYMRVMTRSDLPLANTITATRLKTLDGQGIWGEIVDGEEVRREWCASFVRSLPAG